MYITAYNKFYLSIQARINIISMWCHLMKKEMCLKRDIA